MDESMESEVIFLDSSILIDFFRKAKKEKTAFFRLTEHHNNFAVLVITQFEVYVGSNEVNRPFWDAFFDDFTVLPLSEDCIKAALEINRNLTAKNQKIDFPDLLIAATAKANNLPFVTLNLKHFNRI